MISNALFRPCRRALPLSKLKMPNFAQISTNILSIPYHDNRNRRSAALAPFTLETAIEKIRKADDAWN